MKSCYARRVRLAVICLLFLFFATAASAERVTGVVYDPAGGLVDGARVMLMQDYVKQREMRSDEEGRFAFDSVKPGRYELQIKKDRFSLWQETIDVPAGENGPVHAILWLARMNEVIGVKAQLPPGVEKRKPSPVGRAGGKVEPAQLLTPPRPAFPAELADAGIGGDVVLSATIKTDGTLGDIVVMSSPHPELEKLATATARQFLYTPMKLNGKPVACQNRIVISYRLE